MKSFWKPAARGGRLCAVHSVTLLVSDAPVLEATRTVTSDACRFASAPRSGIRTRWYMYWPASTSLLPCVVESPPSGVIPLVEKPTAGRYTPSGPAYDICIVGPV